jgi:hypothetical protein
MAEHVHFAESQTQNKSTRECVVFSSEISFIAWKCNKEMIVSYIRTNLCPYYIFICETNYNKL